MQYLDLSRRIREEVESAHGMMMASGGIGPVHLYYREAVHAEPQVLGEILAAQDGEEIPQGFKLATSRLSPALTLSQLLQQVTEVVRRLPILDPDQED